MSRVQAERFGLLTFDCYGTLIDWESGILGAFAACFPSGGAEPDPEALLRVYADLEAKLEVESPERLYTDILCDVAVGLGAHFGFEVGAGDAERFAQSVGEWRPFPDTVESLRRLRSAGLKLAVLSNVDRASFGRTAVLLGCEFDAVWVAEDIGSYKPDRRNFEVLLDGARSLGVEPEAILHCAESVRHDIDPAHALGLTTAWVDRRMGRGGGASGGLLPARAPEFRVSDLAGLCEQLGV